jgi:hypothetical protein
VGEEIELLKTLVLAGSPVAQPFDEYGQGFWVEEKNKELAADGRGQRLIIL